MSANLQNKIAEVMLDMPNADGITAVQALARGLALCGAANCDMHAEVCHVNLNADMTVAPVRCGPSRLRYKLRSVRTRRASKTACLKMCEISCPAAAQHVMLSRRPVRLRDHCAMQACAVHACLRSPPWFAVHDCNCFFSCAPRAL